MRALDRVTGLSRQGGVTPRRTIAVQLTVPVAVVAALLGLTWLMELRGGLGSPTRVVDLSGLVIAVVIVLGLLSGWRALRAVLHPLKALDQAAQAIGEGNLTRPIQIEGAREFGALGARMDWMRQQLLEQSTLAARREADLVAAEAHMRELIEQAPVGACVTNRHGVFETVNEAYAAMHGYTPRELIGRPLALLFPPQERAAGMLDYTLRVGDAAAAQRELSVVTKNGMPKTILTSTTQVKGTDGRPRRASFVVDITARKEAEQRLEQLANHDPLTDLPNRALFMDRLTQVLRAIRRSPAPLTLLLLDLDRFKEVNDTLGHDAGDALLCEVAARLRATLRAVDTVARLGGDEFGVLLPDTAEDGALVVAAKILDALTTPIVLGDHVIEVSGSIGIAPCTDRRLDGDALLRQADVAMYVAKRSGNGHAVYDAAQDEHQPGRLTLAAELRWAVAAGDLQVRYRPLPAASAVSDEQTPRVEATVYWPHPEQGLLPPDAFIPVAEQTGLITPLTLWMLDEAVRQCAAWDKNGLSVDVAVTLSLRGLRDGGLPEHIAALLERYGLAPARLTLALPESALAMQPERGRALLALLAETGVRLAIADVGGEYSILGLLQGLPVHEFTMDRTFVRQARQAGAGDDRSLRSLVLALDQALSAVGEAERQDPATPRNGLLAGKNDAADAATEDDDIQPLPPDDLAHWLRAAQEANAADAEAGSARELTLPPRSLGVLTIAATVGGEPGKRLR